MSEDSIKCGQIVIRSFLDRDWYPVQFREPITVHVCKRMSSGIYEANVDEIGEWVNAESLPQLGETISARLTLFWEAVVKRYEHEVLETERQIRKEFLENVDWCPPLESGEKRKVYVPYAVNEDWSVCVYFLKAIPFEITADSEKSIPLYHAWNKELQLGETRESIKLLHQFLRYRLFHAWEYIVKDDQPTDARDNMMRRQLKEAIEKKVSYVVDKRGEEVS